MIITVLKMDKDISFSQYEEYEKNPYSPSSYIVSHMEVNKVGGLTLRLGIFIDLKHQLTKHSSSLWLEKRVKATTSG